ncbi:WD40-repeat-containing domain [Pseudocohnilembus persalinus]|uniref:WD40-repeat-containing domain n=1 Tax=Pseudocohnilembus persalinus TaxID=266149 RepID=A0A0V0R9T6_PSEPJ|nr:WD40-repeat-containing domain [Pseudocohnilembus persalinus]|eukprot:KRX11252.1 WD40-repeat-containing domain [Pseudocohnilembus persalinus]
MINEEYKIWKKNAPFLYDLAITHELDWPSLTVQWLPQKEVSQQGDINIHKLILGTHTSDQADEYLMIAKARLPNEDVEVNVSSYNQNNTQPGGIGNAAGENRIEIEIKMAHEGEVNRAVYNPSKTNVIATRTVSGEVHLFDYTKHPTKPENNTPRPDMRLQGLKGDGYGLAWNVKNENIIGSVGYDNKICIWDIEDKQLGENHTLQPLNTIEYHKKNVEDIKFHVYHPEVFATCGDDKLVCIWDRRESMKQPKFNVNAHFGEIYSLDFSPFNEYLFLTGSEDQTIGFWDMRNPSKRIHTFEGHQDHVLKVEFSPYNVGIFSSTSADRRVIIWDISKCGAEIQNEDEQDGPAEMLFIHGGHRSKVNDFSWNQKDNLVCASVEENNILQIWQMAQNIYDDEDDEPLRNQLGQNKA